MRSAIAVGYMRIEDRDDTFHFGNEKAGGAVVRIKVLHGKFWTRVFT